jgi:pilus assembly protein Flp/PilA
MVNYLKTWYSTTRYKGDEGATAVEYGIMVALIAVVIIAAVFAIGQALQDDFTTVQECLENPDADVCTS